MILIDHRVCPYCGQESAINYSVLFEKGPIHIIGCSACGGSLAKAARWFSLGMYKGLQPVQQVRVEKRPERRSRLDPSTAIALDGLKVMPFFCIAIFLAEHAPKTGDLSYLGAILITALVGVMIGLADKTTHKLLPILVLASSWTGYIGFALYIFGAQLGLHAQIGFLGVVGTCALSLSGRYYK